MSAGTALDQGRTTRVENQGDGDEPKDDLSGAASHPDRIVADMRSGTGDDQIAGTKKTIRSAPKKWRMKRTH